MFFGECYLVKQWKVDKNGGEDCTLPASSLATGQHIVTAVATDSLGQSTQFQIAVITVTP